MLGRFSLGVGDRFARQGIAQIRACQQALAAGVMVTPVWNKSFREHTLIGTTPAATRQAADAAVAASGWTAPYYVDADHITLESVDLFLEACDFFTLDVAQSIGQASTVAEVTRFTAALQPYLGAVSIPGLDAPLQIDATLLASVAARYLAATQQAGKLYRYIAERKGNEGIIEVSMDETTRSQTPEELFCILAALAQEGIPVQTIAPKFCGEFHKGVDYLGDPQAFAREFAADIAVLNFAVQSFGLPATLKLSVHSGSDKFALYPHMHRILTATGAGVHLKTAGTTWLEEIIGLALADGEGLALVKTIYRQAYQRRAELSIPYATVIHIDEEGLPTPEQVDNWDATAFVSAVRHDQSCPTFNPSMRQLLHIGFKIAAELGDRYQQNLRAHAEIIGPEVTRNLYERHLLPLVFGK